MIAAPDLVAYQTGWTVPGLQMFFMPEEAGFEEDAILADYADQAGLSARCEVADVLDYSDKRFNGRYQIFTECAGGSNAVVVIAVPTADGVLVMAIQMIDSRDLGALNRARATFEAVG